MGHPLKLHAPRLIKTILEFQAVESYPLEVMGYLIGFDTRVECATVTTRYEKRTRGVLTSRDDVADTVDQILPDLCIGDWHTHPNEKPVLSYPRDFPRAPESTDFAAMEDGAYEWIVML